MSEYKTDNKVILLVKLSKFAAAIELTGECYTDTIQNRLFWTAPRGGAQESLLDRVLLGHIDEVYNFVTTKNKL